MAIYKAPNTRWRPLPENDRQTDIVPRVGIIHTAVGNANSLFNYWNSDKSEGVESHFYLPKIIQASTPAEEYIDTEVRADCQVDGNPFGISIETWDGYPIVWKKEADIPGFTTSQYEWLVDFMVWCKRTHNIPLRVNTRYNESGWAWHNKYIGDPGYASRPRGCPGDRKISQIPGLLAEAIIQLSLPQEDEVTPQDKTEIIHGVVNALRTDEDFAEMLAKATWERRLNDGNPATAQDPTAESWMAGGMLKVDKLVPELPNQLKDFEDRLNERLESIEEAIASAIGPGEPAKPE